MTNREAALRMLHELIRSETAICNQSTTKRGVTKAALQREFNIMQRIFRALTGETATQEELREASE